ncbi:hypothetical protein T459_25156 [Capsicum annuum]|uniref:O-methyltransferase C-terminal domain-containing protein n=1 Tax=Capsicum annuum TaxID=4072 RepID=A0A2G2YJX2_CAPAN|nr:hypothetical protein T459_25156 [Capsicum annuum]
MKKLRQNHAKKYMKKNGSKKRGSNSPASKAPAKRRRIVEAIFRDELPKFQCVITELGASLRVGENSETLETHTLGGVGKFFVRDEDGASMGPLLALLQDKVFSNSCHCLKLLKNCYKALPDNGKVIVVEANLPAKPDTDTTVIGASQGDLIRILGEWIMMLYEGYTSFKSSGNNSKRLENDHGDVLSLDILSLGCANCVVSFSLFDGSLASVLVGWSLGLAILCARDCVVASIIPQRDFSSLRNRGWSGWLDRVRVELTCDGPFSSVA